MKTASVHIVTYNSEDCIENCLRSVYDQTYPIDKVIVIDNNSSDRTVELIRAAYSDVEVIVNNENLGFAAGHNQALRRSNCDAYLILNPDVIMHPDYLRLLMHHLINQPDTGSFTGLLLRESEIDIVDSAGLVMTKSRRAFDRGSGDLRSKYEESAEVFGVSGAAALYSKALVEDISLEGSFFDEIFFAYKEDIDVAWRSQLMGWKSLYVPEAVAYHRRGWRAGERSRMSTKIRQHSYINRYYMIMKNDHIGYLIKNFWCWLPYDTALFVYLLIREPEVLSSWKTFFASFRYISSQRKWIKNKTKAQFAEVYRYFE